MHGTEHGTIYTLLKFGRGDHLEELRRDGLLYMSPLAVFAKMEESDTGRGDRLEGITTIIQPKHVGTLLINTGNAGSSAISAQQSDLAAPVRIRLKQTASCDVYCMVAVTKPVDGALVPDEVARLGDSFVVITNVREFIRRIARAAEEERNNASYLESKLVEYYDDNEHSGEVGRFRKASRFACQNEFRIVVEPGSDVPRRFIIGSLFDITSGILPTSAALTPWSFALGDKNGD